MIERIRSLLGVGSAQLELRRGLEAERRGERAEAIAHYERATRADPRWSVPWFNLGLLHKRDKRWEASLRCNQRAVELDPRDEAAWWNLGIAAAALGQLDEARRAWAGCGMTVAEDGSIAGFPHPTPVRVDPDGAAEVVWCQRIDPARARVRNVPLRESGRRFGDLVLHDGAPDGERVVGGPPRVRAAPSRSSRRRKCPAEPGAPGRPPPCAIPWVSGVLSASRARSRLRQWARTSSAASPRPSRA